MAFELLWLDPGVVTIGKGRKFVVATFAVGSGRAPDPDEVVAGSGLAPGAEGNAGVTVAFNVWILVVYSSNFDCKT